jgi:hypothetical protein
VDDRYKFIWSSGGDNELYDLRKDPQERANLISSSRSLAARMEARLRAWVAVESAGTVSPDQATPDIPDDVAEQLRNLGYLE